jgi:hypothetical protein
MRFVRRVAIFAALLGFIAFLISGHVQRVLAIY